MLRHLKVLLLMLGLVSVAFPSAGQEVIPLYAGEVPNSKPLAEREKKTTGSDGSLRYEKISNPTLAVYLPEKAKATGAAVLICPGGGYRLVSYTNEGIKVAEAFNKMGVAAFILKYRMPDDSTMVNKAIGPIQDAQQGMKLIRENAGKWNIDPERVGVIGFSAGGHLAASLSVHQDSVFIENKEHTNLRPDFAILGYAVISLTDSLMHKGSRDNLLGTNPTAEATRFWSNELMVSPETPRTLLFHAGDDKTVKVGNSIAFYEACLKNKVEAELHLYPKGGHGFGTNNKTTPDLWMDRVENWMKANGWIK